MGILTKVRQMPDNQKKIFSLITAVILTLVIVVVWFSFSQNSTQNQVAEGRQDKLSSLSPMQVIKEEFSKAFTDIKGNFGDIATTSTSTILIQVVEEVISTSTEISTTTSTSSEIIN